ncbi:phage portal protein, partial [Candidatus Caldatribacterium sp.]|uniref:phage portal protein n=1 Tax=Candidatus Caldatribacterium sp. TaxID=2282143 RepID=UPI00383DC473|nr:phage portal protein [Candidatus Caldatribacterium sp.]
PEEAYKTDGRFRLLTKDDIGYVQVVNGRQVAEFTFDELGYGVFYPRTNVEVYGYGFSELEMTMKEITWQLYASSYNGRYFSQGALPKGILNFKGGNLTKEKLDDFRRQWQAQVAGLTGAWKMPIVSAPDIQFIELQKSNADMEFSAWMDYLVNVICAVYCIDPAEINFPSRGGSGDSHESALFDNSYEVKLRQSRDKGLYPLLDFIANFINKHIVAKIDPDFVFVFEGLDRRMGLERLKAQEIEVRTYKTINEIRREEDLEPIPDGDMLLDSTFVNYRLQMKQLEYQLKLQEMKLLSETIELKRKLAELAQLEAKVGVDTDMEFEDLKEERDEILRLVELLVGKRGKEEDDDEEDGLREGTRGDTEPQDEQGGNGGEVEDRSGGNGAGARDE